MARTHLIACSPLLFVRALADDLNMVTADAVTGAKFWAMVFNARYTRI